MNSKSFGRGLNRLFSQVLGTEGATVGSCEWGQAKSQCLFWGVRGLRSPVMIASSLARKIALRKHRGEMGL